MQINEVGGSSTSRWAVLVSREAVSACPDLSRWSARILGSLCLFQSSMWSFAGMPASFKHCRRCLHLSASAFSCRSLSCSCTQIIIPEASFPILRPCGAQSAPFLSLTEILGFLSLTFLKQNGLPNFVRHRLQEGYSQRFSLSGRLWLHTCCCSSWLRAMSLSIPCLRSSSEQLCSARSLISLTRPRRSSMLYFLSRLTRFKDSNGTCGGEVCIMLVYGV